MPTNTEAYGGKREISLFSIRLGPSEKEMGVGSGVLTKNLIMFKGKTVLLKALSVLRSQT